jgi:hypothetical protein
MHSMYYSHKLVNSPFDELKIKSWIDALPQFHATSLDLADLNIAVQDFLNLASKIKDPSRIHKVSICADWKTVGDLRIVDCLNSFINLKELRLSGRGSTSVFYGFDNRALRSMKHTQLELLYIQGYGAKSFDFEGLLRLVHQNPNIRQLDLDHVNGTVDLNELALLPRLETVNLTFVMSTGRCSPRVKGSLPKRISLHVLHRECTANVCNFFRIEFYQFAES